MTSSSSSAFHGSRGETIDLLHISVGLATTIIIYGSLVAYAITDSISATATFVLYSLAVTHALVVLQSEFRHRAKREEAYRLVKARLILGRDVLRDGFHRGMSNLRDTIQESWMWRNTTDERQQVRKLWRLSVEHPWHVAGIAVLAMATGIDVVVLWVVETMARIVAFPICMVLLFLVLVVKTLCLRFASRSSEVFGNPLGGVLACVASAYFGRQRQISNEAAAEAVEAREEACATSPVLMRATRGEVSDKGDHGICCICLRESSTHAFIPCGHRCCCARDGPRVLREHSKCPVCNEVSHAVVRIFDT